MELTYEEWAEARKGVKRYMSVPNWALLIYYGIMNVAVFCWMLVEMVTNMIRVGLSGDSAAMESVIMESAQSAWGYFIAAAIGFVILLIWKKPRYLKNEIFAKNRPMKAGEFFAILCIFLSGQLIFQLGASGLELILNAFGYTIAEGIESMQVDPDNFSMFLYAGLLAPVTEELLFRGLIQRTMLPFGKRIAIFASALTFGLFHGNLLQGPYAFAVGLVLGYVAVEYNILWAMVLHMINNLVLADMIYRLLGSLPDDTVNVIIWLIILVCSVVAAMIMIAKRKQIAAWLRENHTHREYVKCYFSCAGTILVLIILGLSTIFTTWMLVTPL
jgi:membrane protease YdiL (CAAX protease family)